MDSDLPKSFARLLFQLCHIILGLRPQSRREEGEIVRGWLEREEKFPLMPGSMWYVINNDWWTQWHAYVGEGSGDSRVRRPLADGSSAGSSINGDESVRRMDSLNSTASSTPSPSPRSTRKSSTPSRPGMVFKWSRLVAVPVIEKIDRRL